MEHSHAPRGPTTASSPPQKQRLDNSTIVDGVHPDCMESSMISTYHPPSTVPSPKRVEWVYNPSDGSVLLDHRRRPISVDKILATKPLRGELSSRPGPGGKRLTYISGEGVSRTLNDIFGFDGWNLDITKVQREECIKDDKGRFTVVYTAMVRLTHKKSGAYKEDCGAGDSTDKVFGTAVAHALKASITDAMKRAARHFGDKLGNSLYQGNFSINKAPVTLKDALDKLDIERANTKFGFPKDLAASSKTGSVSTPVATGSPPRSVQSIAIAHTSSGSNATVVTNAHIPQPPNSSRNGNGSVGIAIQNSSSSSSKLPQRPVGSNHPNHQPMYNQQTTKGMLRTVPLVQTNPSFPSQSKQQVAPTNAGHSTTLNSVSSGTNARPSHMDTTRHANDSAPHVGKIAEQEHPRSSWSRGACQQPNTLHGSHGPYVQPTIHASSISTPRSQHEVSPPDHDVQSERQQHKDVGVAPPKTSSELLRGSSLFQDAQSLPSRPSTSSGRKPFPIDDRRASTGNGNHIQPVPQVTPVSINGKRPPFSNVHNIDPTRPKKHSVNPYASRQGQ